MAVESQTHGGTAKPTVGLFVTCLVDIFRPRVAFAAIALLEAAGCRVEIPDAQTCCGQPALNSGDLADSRAIARQVLAAFEAYDYVVGPSGSCLATIKHDYPDLLKDDPAWLSRAQRLSERTYELTSFLVDVMGLSEVDVKLSGSATYHDSCSGLRSLGVKSQPRTLLASVDGLSLTEMRQGEVCCGFGGTFCVKYPDISSKMATDKVNNIVGTGADMILGGDLGCLMNISGRLTRLGKTTRVYHVAEVLAGMADGPGIGEGKEG